MDDRDKLFEILAAHPGLEPTRPGKTPPAEDADAVSPKTAWTPDSRAISAEKSPEAMDYSIEPAESSKAEEAPPAPESAPEAAVPAGVKYDAFMYEPIGFDRTDRAAAEEISRETVKKERRLRSRRERTIVITFFIIAAAALVLAFYGIISDIIHSGSALGRIQGGQVVLYRSSKPKGANDLSNFQDENGRYTTEGVAAVVKPSIVEIYTYSDSRRQNLMGTGSGVVITGDGYIVTNAHVLQADGYHDVHSVDGDIYPAQIVGKDAKTDIAVIKVAAGSLEPAVLGDSDEVLVGEQVIAIGNPAGLSSTVTDGIVSAVNRKIRSDSTGFLMDCIQTDAAISPGNSGGALVNMYGQVIGITSSKYVSSSYEGLGFAITINEARPIIEDLITNGFVPGRFRVGISFIETQDPSRRQDVEQYSGITLPDDFYGLYITDISGDCDISNTDLKIGDFIVSIDGTVVSNYDELNSILTESYGPGDYVKAACAHLNEDGTIDEYEIEFMLMSDTSGNF